MCGLRFLTILIKGFVLSLECLFVFLLKLDILRRLVHVHCRSRASLVLLMSREVSTGETIERQSDQILSSKSE